MKASDVPEDKVIAIVRQAEFPTLGQNRWAIQAALKEFPPKRIDAKLRSMVKKGILKGCDSHHDCRGDFTIVELKS